MKFATALVLGSTLALSSGFAAELPTREARPAANPEARTCTVDGEPGIVLPGGDTCMRISGSISAQVSAGALSRQWRNSDP